MMEDKVQLDGTGLKVQRGSYLTWYPDIRSTGPGSPVPEIS